MVTVCKKRGCEIVFFAALIISTFLNCFVFLFRPIRYDEAFSFVFFSSKSFFKIISDYSFPNNHILYNLFAHLVYIFFGGKPYLIRLPAFFGGIGMICANFFFVKKLFSEECAYLSSSLLSFTPILIMHSVNARGYSLIIFFSLLLFYSVVSILKKDEKRWWIIFILFSVLGFYTIPIMLYPLSVAVFLIFSFSKDKRIIKKAIVALFIILLFAFLLYLPVILNSGLSSLLHNRFVKPQEWKVFLAQIFPFIFSLWTYWQEGLPPFVRVSLILFFLFSFLAEEKKRLFLFILSVISANFFVLFLTRRVPPPRCWLYLLPLYYAISCLGLVKVIKKILKKFKIQENTKIFLFFGLFVVFLGGYFLPSFLNNKIIEEVPMVVKCLKTSILEKDKVISSSYLALPLKYYFLLENIPVEFIKMKRIERRAFVVFDDVREAERIFVIVKNKKELKSLLRKFDLVSPIFSLKLLYAGKYLKSYLLVK